MEYLIQIKKGLYDQVIAYTMKKTLMRLFTCLWKEEQVDVGLNSTNVVKGCLMRLVTSLYEEQKAYVVQNNAYTNKGCLIQLVTCLC